MSEALSLGDAAREAGMKRGRFIEFCEQHNIPIFNGRVDMALVNAALPSEVAGEQVERWTICRGGERIKRPKKSSGPPVQQVIVGPDTDWVEVVPASRLEQAEQERDEAQARVASMTASALPVEAQERFIARVTERQSEERERAWTEAEQRAEQAEQRVRELEAERDRERGLKEGAHGGLRRAWAEIPGGSESEEFLPDEIRGLVERAEAAESRLAEVEGDEA